jgi:glycine/D-amino acid oxidase-like deaminating enzyme
MADAGRIQVDVVIFGGGAAGLWLLDELSRAGYAVLLLEANELGTGQTIASQGIVHGGLKYTLSGLLTSSARAIRDMPLIWRRSLAGEHEPDLSRTRLRAEYCHLWQTRAWSSRVGMLGARAGLHVAPVRLERGERPSVLHDCPGIVARLDEQVIDIDSFLVNLYERNAQRILKIDRDSGLELACTSAGVVELIRLIDPDSGAPADISAHRVVFTAGSGNAALRRAVGLPEDTMQLRPLHMVAVRGDLPLLNGHCVDGAHTRATITSVEDFAGGMIWLVGGQIAEDGVGMSREALIGHARVELAEILPGFPTDRLEWTTYTVDRAEYATKGGIRPNEARITVEGNTISAWPTKFALAPQLAERVMKVLPSPQHGTADDVEVIRCWPRPEIAAAPWEQETTWSADD